MPAEWLEILRCTLRLHRYTIAFAITQPLAFWDEWRASLPPRERRAATRIGQTCDCGWRFREVNA